MLASKKYVDLTHEFAPGIPRWPGFPDETRKTIYWYDKRPDTMGSGFFSELFTHVGQMGTHVDPPAHFIKGLRTVDQIDPKEMLLPLVVIDVHEEAAKNPDYTLSLDRVKKWEKDHGQIPAGAFVAMRTDWSKRWPDAAKMENKDTNGVAHYPGWSLPALKYLYEDRKITASGHETTDTDPGFAASKDDYSLETYILSTNHYQIDERAACVSPELQQLIRIDIDCHVDVFGEWQFVGGLTHKAAEAHDGFASDQNVETELALQFFQWRGGCIAQNEFFGQRFA